MGLYISEADFAALQRQGNIRVISETPARKPMPCVAAAPSGVSVEDMDEPPRKRNKYGNRRVVVDGKIFDSQHEADYYFDVLLPMRQAGKLKLLLRQVPFELPGGIKYIADFFTVDQAGEVTVIDAKSEATRKNRVYINKKKQMKAIWGIEIREV